MKKHKHNFTLQSVAYEYPQAGYSGTVGAVQYAYLMCNKCWEVRKTEVLFSKGGER